MSSENSIVEMQSVASEVRAQLVALSNRSGAPHLASSLSCVDLLVALYSGCLNINSENASQPDRDRFILSKGHAAPALYAILAKKGIIPAGMIDSFATVGGALAEQPAPGCAPGVEWATGSLGHGLGVGIGKALAGRIQQDSFSVAVLMSDGECNEGSVWEAAMYAPARKLENLLVVIDFNKWQATGRSQEIMAMDPLAEKWRAFGWNTFEIDGHDFDEISAALAEFPSKNGKPTAIVANTVKGKGVDFMEDDNNWHYRIPSDEEVTDAKRQLGVA